MQQAKRILTKSFIALNEHRDPLMLNILKQILIGYDDLGSERLSQTKIYLSKGDPEGRFCRGRKIRKRGYRNIIREVLDKK